MNASNTDSFVKSHLSLFDAEEEAHLFEDWLTSPEGKAKDRIFEKIVLNYTPLIKRLIKELSGYKMDPQEMTSVGLISLVKAAHAFDPSMGFRFSTFAKTSIRGDMMTHITNNYFMVRVCTSREKKKLFFTLRRMIASHQKLDGSFELTPEIAFKISTELGINVNEIYSMYSMFGRPYESLAEPLGGEGSDTRGDVIPDGGMNPEDDLSHHQTKKLQKQIVRQGMEVLNKRERFIFEQQILGTERTLEDIGKELGVSKERVRQLRVRAMEKFQVEVIRLARVGNISRSDLML